MNWSVAECFKGPPATSEWDCQSSWNLVPFLCTGAVIGAVLSFVQMRLWSTFLDVSWTYRGNNRMLAPSCIQFVTYASLKSATEPMIEIRYSGVTEWAYISKISFFQLFIFKTTGDSFIVLERQICKSVCSIIESFDIIFATIWRPRSLASSQAFLFFVLWSLRLPLRTLPVMTEDSSGGWKIMMSPFLGRLFR